MRLSGKGCSPPRRGGVARQPQAGAPGWSARRNVPAGLLLRLRPIGLALRATPSGRGGILFILLLLAFALDCSAQTLADAARQERERQKRLHGPVVVAKGTPTTTTASTASTAAAVVVARGTPTTTTASTASTAAAVVVARGTPTTTAASTASTAAAVVVARGTPTTTAASTASTAAVVAPAGPAGPTDNKGRDEKYWRAQFQKARDDFKKAEERVQLLDLKVKELNTQILRQSDVYNREYRLGPEIADAQKQLDESRKAADQAKKKITDLEDELRRSGGLPGWAR